MGGPSGAPGDHLAQLRRFARLDPNTVLPTPVKLLLWAVNEIETLRARNDDLENSRIDPPHATWGPH